MHEGFEDEENQDLMLWKNLVGVMDECVMSIDIAAKSFVR